MRKGLISKKIVAYVCAATMMFCGFAGITKATPVAAAETEIQLDDAASGMNKTLHIDKAAKGSKDDLMYAYQGFVTFKDLADKLSLIHISGGMKSLGVGPFHDELGADFHSRTLATVDNWEEILC